MNKTQTYEIPADQLGAGDKIKVGRTWRTITDAVTYDLLTEITSTVYNEVKRDYVAKSEFVERAKMFQVQR